MIYLQHLGMVFYDSTNDCSMFQIVYSVILFITCTCSFILIPSVVLEFDDWSKAFSTSISVIVCSTVTVSMIISRVITMYNVKYKHLEKYKTTLESFEIYIPMTAEASNHVKYFAFTAILLYVVVVLPANGVKLYNLSFKHPNSPITMSIYFLSYYLQNLSMCCTEIHYAIQCFVVYTKFRDINEQLEQLNGELKVKHAAMHLYDEDAQIATSPAGSTDVLLHTILYEKDFYHPKDGEYPLANVIELLKIKHWLTREAVYDIKYLFSIPICLSIICVTTVMLFDVYTQFFYSNANQTIREVFRSQILFISWVLQYTMRFCFIVVTTHTLTKQVNHIRHSC